jgi:hypothetical protein
MHFLKNIHVFSFIDGYHTMVVENGGQQVHIKTTYIILALPFRNA